MFLLSLCWRDRTILSFSSPASNSLLEEWKWFGGDVMSFFFFLLERFCIWFYIAKFYELLDLEESFKTFLLESFNGFEPHAKYQKNHLVVLCWKGFCGFLVRKILDCFVWKFFISYFGNGNFINSFLLESSLVSSWSKVIFLIWVIFL